VSASPSLLPDGWPRRLAGAALGTAVACVMTATAHAGPLEPALVRVATTGNNSELVKTLPITSRPGASPRVVMSMGPRALPSLTDGDRLDVTAEFQVTDNCNYRSARCVGRIYHYDPRVRAKLVLAASASATDGAGTLQLGHYERETCTQHKPDREHHCVLVFTGTRLDLTDPAALPCELDACHLNLVADAHQKRARHGDLIMVGGQRPDGHIPQDRGRINVVRYRDAAPADFRTQTTTSRLRTRLRPNFHRRVVYSQRLDGLRDGEQLAIGAQITLDISDLRYALRDSTRLILADSPRATRQSAFVKSVALGRGEIAENNGSNCTQDERLCVSRKVGVLEMRRDAVDGAGRPVPLYVNLVTVVGPKAAKAKPRDRVIVRRRGGITVTRFPSRFNG
jgi:hypothetical protein